MSAAAVLSVIMIFLAWLVRKWLDPSIRKDLIGGKEIEIEIRNLTKIYGDPPRFIRDWGKIHRQEKRMLEVQKTQHGQRQ